MRRQAKQNKRKQAEPNHSAWKTVTKLRKLTKLRSRLAKLNKRKPAKLNHSAWKTVTELRK